MTGSGQGNRTRLGASGFIALYKSEVLMPPRIRETMLAGTMTAVEMTEYTPKVGRPSMDPAKKLPHLQFDRATLTPFTANGTPNFKALHANSDRMRTRYGVAAK